MICMVFPSPVKTAWNPRNNLSCCLSQIPRYFAVRASGLESGCCSVVDHEVFQRLAIVVRF